MSKVLAPRDIAAAIGASESSIKRWIDAGAIRSARTSGGHRRISTAEAIRFVRERGFTVLRPEILGLAEVPPAAERQRPADAGRLSAFLTEGADAQARGLITGLYLDGMAVADIVDGPLRIAIAEIGKLWQTGEEGIFVEHRATEICMRAFTQLRALLPEAPGAPSAVGGAGPGDPYQLPSLGASTVLAAEGFAAVNLGAGLPVSSLERAVQRLSPRIAWMSVSAASDPARLRGEIVAFAARARRAGVHVAIGGRALEALALPLAANLHPGRSMAELAAFARGLRAASGIAGGGAPAM